MRKLLFAIATLALIGGGVALAASGGQDVLKDPARADCPGLIECPLTGEKICADDCPLSNGERADGPAAPCCSNK